MHDIASSQGLGLPARQRTSGKCIRPTSLQSYQSDIECNLTWIFPRGRRWLSSSHPLIVDGTAMPRSRYLTHACEMPFTTLNKFYVLSEAQSHLHVCSPMQKLTNDAIKSLVVIQTSMSFGENVTFRYTTQSNASPHQLSSPRSL